MDSFQVTKRTRLHSFSSPAVPASEAEGFVLDYAAGLCGDADAARVVMQAADKGQATMKLVPPGRNPLHTKDKDCTFIDVVAV